VLGFCGLVLGEIQGIFPSYGKIIHGESFKTRRVKLDEWIASARNIIEEIGKIEPDTDLPWPVLTNNCKTCEFMNNCRSQAQTKDDLSLLRGLSGKDISKLNNRASLRLLTMLIPFERGEQEAIESVAVFWNSKP
jgi:predicted RecB family nuclease